MKSKGPLSLRGNHSPFQLPLNFLTPREIRLRYPSASRPSSMPAVTPGGGLTTDVAHIISVAFPNGKPEMAATDFKRAYEITKSTLAGNPRPAKTSLDYPTWAHCLMVEWKVVGEQERKAGRPEPNHLTCPECGVSMLLDHVSSDVLTCPGGCNRAITISAFTSLFKVSKPAPNAGQPKVSAGLGQPKVSTGLGQQLRAQQYAQMRYTGSPLLGSTSSRRAGITSTIAADRDPVAAGIVEKMPKSRKPLSSYRCWYVEDGTDDVPVLKSISYKEHWPPMEPIHAKCVGQERENIDHDCPSWSHRCGVYSVKAVEFIKRWGGATSDASKRVMVIGEIEMWGRVLEYHDGFRSEFAYPLRLWVPESWGYSHNWKNAADLAEKLWGQYLVEVIVDDEIFERALHGEG